MRFNGHTDVDLTPVGAAQLEAVAEDLEDVDFSAVYSSDLKRAAYGGAALVRSRNLELNIEPAFREIWFGDWEGMNAEEIERHYPGQLEIRMKDIAYHRPPGGEAIKDVWDRVEKGMEELLTRHQGSNVALVAHSGVNRVILLQALGCGPEPVRRIHQDYGCLNIVEYWPGADPVIQLTNKPNRVHGI